MTIIQHAAGAAVFALAGLSPIPAGAETRIPVSVRIDTADLNLSRVEGRDALRRRIATAARAACNSDVMRPGTMSDARRCYREMIADGAQKIAGLTGDRPVAVASLDPR